MHFAIPSESEKFLQKIVSMGNIRFYKPHVVKIKKGIRQNQQKRNICAGGAKNYCQDRAKARFTKR